MQKIKAIRVEDFSLAATMECGQCFNFNLVGENEYIITAFRHVVHVRQEKNELIFINDVNPSSDFEKEVEEIWLPYFDLKRDYKKIREDIIKLDKKNERGCCIQLGNKAFKSGIL